MILLPYVYSQFYVVVKECNEICHLVSNETKSILALFTVNDTHLVHTFYIEVFNNSKVNLKKYINNHIIDKISPPLTKR